MKNKDGRDEELLNFTLKNLRLLAAGFWGNFSVRVFSCLVLSMAFLILLFNLITIHSQQKLVTSFIERGGRNLTNLLADTVRLGVFSENDELLAAPVGAILNQPGVLNVQVLNKKGDVLFADRGSDASRVDRCEKIMETMRQSVEEKILQSPAAVDLSNKDCLIYGAPVMIKTNQSEERLYFADGSQDYTKNDPAGFVIVAFNPQSHEKSIRRVITENVAIALVFLLLAVLTTYQIVKSATRPLSRLVTTIKSSELHTGRHDDIGLLSESFSSMLDQLADSFAMNRKLQEDLEDLARELLMAQENERQKLALELHDNVAQELSTLKIYCSKLLDGWPDPPEPVVDGRKRMSGSIQKSIRMIRELSHGLQPSELGQFGLVSTISHLCDDFVAANDIEIDFMATGFEDFEPAYNISINCYRIIQEALNNVQKHAQASLVEIRIIASFPKIILRINDDGVGFDFERISIPGLSDAQIGLWNMEKRATLLNGILSIQSQPAMGTRIFVEIPYTRRNYGNATKDTDC